MPSRPVAPLALAGLLMLACGLTGPAAAQNKPPPAPTIYTCNTPDGRRLTSDRPIAECQAREQRMLNSDGSVRKMVPPAMSPEEQVAADQRKRNEEVQRAAQQDAIRRDRNLLQRFADQAAHQRAREGALDDIREAMQQSEKRLQVLATERKPMLDEAEFYKGKRLPLKLQHQLDTNEAAAAAQRESIDNQKAEIVRVNKLYDEELSRLKRLWAGAAPGSLDNKPAASGASQAPPAKPPVQASPASGR
ncbi:hypothetical protein [Mitsuaria sp. GD03876]|uniref:hypothetical protein n=1 Tax=Mitsuaria sp. GD03876 TaxID=2975399 RepID=UPI00244C6C41|nr:hypothetical protein [Mitsuaria sp. GD03876]MDH0865532.1 hypothetical protein [Mitsuaria sp. GD03876]